MQEIRNANLKTMKEGCKCDKQTTILSPLGKQVKLCRFASLDESFSREYLLLPFNAHNDEKHVADVGSVVAARNEESD